MSLEFKYDTLAGVVFTVGRGIVSFEEVIEHRSKILSHPKYNKNHYHLADFREVTMSRSTGQARHLSLSNPFAKVAIVAGENSYGFARMAQGWGEEGTYGVFRDMASAREWLGLETEDNP